jgi:N-formylglutamate deformylase
VTPRVPRIVRPAGPPIPVVVSVPHAGRLIPDDERDLYALSQQTLDRDLDLHVDRLFADVPSLGATLITSDIHRFVVDLNRRADDTCGTVVEGATARRAPGYYGSRGVIWGVTTRGESVYRERLSRERYEARIAAYHEPYHRALRGLLDELRAQFGHVVLIDGHSMPSKAVVMHPDAGAERADVVPGDVCGASCGPQFTHDTCCFWSGRGYTVALNEPYRGGAITRGFGRPAAGCHAIQVEFNRARYMDEESLELHAGFETLRRDCLDFVDKLAHTRETSAEPRRA